MDLWLQVLYNSPGALDSFKDYLKHLRHDYIEEFADSNTLMDPNLTYILKGKVEFVNNLLAYLNNITNVAHHKEKAHN